MDNNTMDEIKIVKKAGRPRKLFTEEDKKAYRKKYNDMRPPYIAVYKTCEICNKTIYGANISHHRKTEKHQYLAKIQALTNQLEKQLDNSIS